jgi:hypothetical protein
VGDWIEGGLGVGHCSQILLSFDVHGGVEEDAVKEV